MRMRTCETAFNGKIELFFQNVKQGVLESCKRLRSRAHARRTPLCIRYAFEQLRQGAWCAVVTDKDGGYCLAPKTWLHYRRQILGGPHYERLPGTLDARVEDCTILYPEAVRAVKDITDDSK